MGSVISSIIKCILIGVNLAIGLIFLAKWSIHTPELPYTYKGNGMALCHTKLDSERAEDVITLEFKEFEVAEANQFTFILHDDSTVTAFTPCLVNFDKKGSKN